MIASTNEPLKIVMLGEGRVGKTSLTLQFVKKSFNTNEESTWNANFLEKSLVIEGEKIDLTIWDTAGQEKFRALTPLYYRDCAGAILVYDLSYRESFDRIYDWVQELKLHSQQSQCPIEIMLAGNKCDLPPQTYQIPIEQAEIFAYNIGATHMLTSAKTGQGTEELFDTLAKKILQSRKGVKVNGFNFDQKRLSVQITQQDLQQRKNTQQMQIKKSGCC